MTQPTAEPIHKKRKRTCIAVSSEEEEDDADADPNVPSRADLAFIAPSDEEGDEEESTDEDEVDEDQGEADDAADAAAAPTPEPTQPIDNYYKNTPCQVCKLGNRADVLVLCDGCDQGWHTDCIGLDEVPDGDFFCAACTETRQHQKQKKTSRQSDSQPKRRRLRQAKDGEESDE